MSEKKRISLTLTMAYVEALDQLVEEGIYMEHQAAIRDALRILFRLHGMEPFYLEPFYLEPLEIEDADQEEADPESKS